MQTRNGPPGDLLHSGILTIEEAILRFGREKRNGLRIVFTNGCFDLLHPGHIQVWNKRVRLATHSSSASTATPVSAN